MGAQVARLQRAVEECGGNKLHLDPLEILGGGEQQELVLQVTHAPIDDARGALLTDYKVGSQLKVTQLATLSGLEPLAHRYHEKMRSQWPSSYRFQVHKRTWQVRVASDDSFGPEQVCLLQLASSPDDRTLDNVKQDVEDAQVAAAYAQRFNLQQQQADIGADAGNPDNAMGSTYGQTFGQSLEQVECSMPTVKVAAPVACEVIFSGYPSMVPIGVACTLIPYAEKEVQKFVFDGHSDEFLELPQAYFHYAAFASGGKEYICDIQGVEHDDGSFVLVDPCVLKAGLPTIRHLVGVAVNGHVQEEFSNNGPTVERFDALHPKCSQLCKTFDPMRRSAQRNGKGMCGMGTCGMTFAKCGR